MSLTNAPAEWHASAYDSLSNFVLVATEQCQRALEPRWHGGRGGRRLHASQKPPCKRTNLAFSTPGLARLRGLSPQLSLSYKIYSRTIYCWLACVQDRVHSCTTIQKKQASESATAPVKHDRGLIIMEHAPHRNTLCGRAGYSLAAAAPCRLQLGRRRAQAPVPAQHLRDEVRAYSPR
jgi:hypothetical protein